MIASYTLVFLLFYYGIGLRPENLSALAEPFCGRYILRPWLSLVRRMAWTPVYQHPVKDLIPRMLVYVLCAWRARRRTASTVCVHMSVFFFADVILNH